MLAIAHGGGALNGQPYTNSLEALNASYARGFRWVELDFKRTADGAVGCRHDWNDFGGDAPTLAALRQRFAGRFTPLCADSLAGWMAAHPDTTLVTDVKEQDQMPVLRDLAAAGVPKDRTVVQLFDPKEDEPARALGYGRRSIILYRYQGSLHRLRRFVRPGTAVGLSVAQAKAGLHRRLPGCVPWVYTVNDAGLARHLAGQGVQGLFTDTLAPGQAGLSVAPPAILFVYGTLAHERVQREVFGRPVPMRPARLPGFDARTVVIEDPKVVRISGSGRHPGAVRREGAVLQGHALRLSAEDLAKADAYEAQGYERRLVTLSDGAPAFLYEPKREEPTA